jgi:hypothetical protein
LLTTLAGSLDFGRAGSGGFDGRPERAEFSTWLVDVNGWPEPRRVAMEVRDGALMVDGLSTYGLVLADSVRSVAFDYLVDSSAAVTWVHTWESQLSAPRAFRLRLARERGTSEGRTVDTLLLVVGPRG